MDIAVIGLGLIGGSLLRALAARGHRLLGYDADPATRATARTAAARAPAGGRWQVTGSARDAARNSALTVLAVPLPAVPGVLDDLAAVGYAGLITDVTSVKRPVRELVAARLPAGTARYVGGHPMAGRESSGFAVSDPDLFTGAAWVLCLEPDTPLPGWLELAALVTSLGVRVVPTSADEHDRAVAAVSHVPHLAATAMAAAAAGDPLTLTLAAGSFADGTRVAATRPALVAAMCGGNAGPVRGALDEVIVALQAARAALDDPEPVAAVQRWLGRGHAVRAAWPPKAVDCVELPARADILLRLGRAGGWVTEVAADRRTVTAARPAPGAGGDVG